MFRRVRSIFKKFTGIFRRKTKYFESDGSGGLKERRTGKLTGPDKSSEKPFGYEFPGKFKRRKDRESR